MNSGQQISKQVELLRLGVCPFDQPYCGHDSGYVCVRCVRGAMELAQIWTVRDAQALLERDGFVARARSLGEIA